MDEEESFLRASRPLWDIYDRSSIFERRLGRRRRLSSFEYRGKEEKFFSSSRRNEWMRNEKKSLFFFILHHELPLREGWKYKGEAKPVKSVDGQKGIAGDETLPERW
jgi:hypothetical protein